METGDGDVRYVSILPGPEEIQARLKASMEVVPGPRSVVHVHSEDDIRPAKRRRKSDCPSRPKKRSPAKFSLTASLDHRAAAQLQCSEFIQQTTYTNGHFASQHQQTQPNFSSHNHDSNYFTAAANQYHDARRQQGNSSHFNAGGSYQNGMLPSPAREFSSSLPYCSTAQPVYNNVSMCDDPDRQALPDFEGDSSSNSMQNLLAAVRMSMTGSLTTGHHSNHNNTSRSSSSLATLSPYQSPSGRVFSPVSGGGGDFGFSPSQASAGWSLASPNRLPSIGESFFGGQNSCSSSQSRIMSPLPPMESHHIPVDPAVWSDAGRGRPPLLNGSAVPVVTLRNESVLEGGPVEFGNKGDRKRRSCSIDAANILASVSIPRISVIVRTSTATEAIAMPDALPVTARTDDLPIQSSWTKRLPVKNSTSSSNSEMSPEMPDALPVRASVSPFLNGTESIDGAALESIPPPLSVTIDENRQCIRLKIKASAWKASPTYKTDVLAPAAASLPAAKVQSAPPAPSPPKPTIIVPPPQRNDLDISPVRVKKKVTKFSPPDIPVKASVKSAPSGSKTTTPVSAAAGPKKRGRPPSAAVAERCAASIKPPTTPACSALPVLQKTLTKVTKELLSDFTSPESLLAIARFETLDMRSKFDAMPAQVQHQIMAFMPKSWTIIAPDGRQSLKPGVLSRTDSKFRQHVATWQSNLASGEYDNDVRRRYIDMAVGNMDPWKVANFEPIYGEIMAASSSSRLSSSSLLASSSTHLSPINGIPPAGPVKLSSNDVG